MGLFIWKETVISKISYIKQIYYLQIFLNDYEKYLFFTNRC